MRLVPYCIALIVRHPPRLKQIMMPQAITVNMTYGKSPFAAKGALVMTLLPHPTRLQTNFRKRDRSNHAGVIEVAMRSASLRSDRPSSR